MKIRIKFSKNGVMRFVGHLDLLRFFQRAFRRAGVDMAYSEGFSPHPIISFALPLGLGYTSDGEYLDIELNSAPSSCEMIEMLNREMAEGMGVTGCVRLRDGAKKAMAAVAAADYVVYFRHREDFSQEEAAAGIRSWYAESDVIPVTKQTKKGERVIDIKPLLYRFEPYADDRVDCPDNILSDSGLRRGFFLRLSAGSTDNIRPELVLEDFYSFAGKTYDRSNIQIHRLELYEAAGGDETAFVPLIAAGEEILCQEE